MNILVTGGAGRLGNVLVRELVKEGNDVKVLTLPNSKNDSLKGVKCELIEGNILDPIGLKKILKGIDQVYHLAAMISIVSYDRDKVFKVNVEGTNNIINACLESNVKKLIYVSTIHALDEKNKEIIDETAGFNIHTHRGNYDQSKAQASINVLEAVKNKGLDAIIICPTGIIGPYDYEVSFFSQYIEEYVNKRLFFFIDGSYDFVDVRDVAKGMAKLSVAGKKGEIYLLSGENVKIKEFNEILFQETKIPKPLKIPYFLSYFFSFFTQAYYKLAKKTPVITPYSLSTLKINSIVSHKKATDLIDYNPRSFKESFIDQIRWMKKRGIINY
ncbi:MAG: NAD-dependent epimerase/dehydratase family protein [Candidatus Nanoarchaeia archaeon]|nr:NAD-dependent epimerase/dehydratase family protein [Candidatus Nanoarchaeia archaeon]